MPWRNGPWRFAPLDGRPDRRNDARVCTSSSISTAVTMILNGIGIGAIPAVARELRERKVRLLDVAGGLAALRLRCCLSARQ
jgi:DNA-binding transcriptional LysR family regulator